MGRFFTASSHPRLARFARDHLGWFRSALLVDWAVVAALTLISLYVESKYPYERDPGHYLGDNDISWPHVVVERVSVRRLDDLAFKVPALIVVVIAAVKLSLHDLHHALLVLCSSRAIMRITVESLKNRVGRLRPDFLDRCAWSVLEKTCTGPLDLVKDGRRSFPSGHSGTAFQGLFFLCLFIAGKNGAFAFGATFPRSGPFQSRLLRFSLAVSPLFLAAWICVTRLEDHMHHPTDVLAGSTVGILSALAVYLTYYPSPFDSSDVAAMHLPRLVYGKDEPLEGRINLGLEGEEEGEGLLSGTGTEEV